MDCIIYMDLFFLLNFWMNVLILFLVRQMIKTYRTFYCLAAAMIGALGSCGIMTVYIVQGQNILFVLAEFFLIVLMNLIAFGGKNLLWHLALFSITGATVGGVFLFLVPFFAMEENTVMIGIVSIIACVFCIFLEKNSRVRWKEEFMKAKTVLEFADRKVFATALIDTGNKLYDPFFHKPVILVDGKMMKEMLAYCKRECPERMQYIPFHSVGKEHGMLEGIIFDKVSIQWQGKKLQFPSVIAAATRENLYEGKEYQVIFHCGLLEEG